MGKGGHVMGKAPSSSGTFSPSTDAFRPSSAASEGFSPEGEDACRPSAAFGGASVPTLDATSPSAADADFEAKTEGKEGLYLYDGLLPQEQLAPPAPVTEDPPTLTFDSEVGAHFSPSLFHCSPEEYRERIAALTADTPKADDAEVPVIIWDNGFRRSWPGSRTGSDGRPPDGGIGWRRALWRFRRWLISVYRRRLTREFSTWLGTANSAWPPSPQGRFVRRGLEGWRWRHDGRRRYQQWHRTLRTDPNFLVGSDAVRRGVMSSWFQWDEGSTPMFWRWPEEFRERVRDGQRHLTLGPLPGARSKRRSGWIRYRRRCGSFGNVTTSRQGK